MGFIIVAKNSRSLFIATELAWTLFNVSATWLLVREVGLAGAGAAFFLSYLFHIAMIYPSVRALSGFRWSRTNLETGFLYTLLAAVVFGAFYVLPPWQATLFGSTMALASTVYSARVLLALIPPHRLPRRVYGALACLRIVRTDEAPERSVQ
jgi:PST family polysaccharide transporter